MTLATAAEFAALLAAAARDSPRRRTDWASSAPRTGIHHPGPQGRTDVQIARHLCISISTVRSHLDRIRDKTAWRRRADLTRLALRAGLV